MRITVPFTFLQLKLHMLKFVWSLYKKQDVKIKLLQVLLSKPFKFGPWKTDARFKN